MNHKHPALLGHWLRGGYQTSWLPSAVSYAMVDLSLQWNRIGMVDLLLQVKSMRMVDLHIQFQICYHRGFAKCM